MKNLIATVLSATLALAAAVPAIASPVGGPQYDRDVLEGRHQMTYTMDLWAGETTEILVSGDGDSDLDLFVYDRFGNLIASDRGASDQARVSLRVFETGEFRIVIVNLGSSANLYEMLAR